jgi:hypothetical protein
VCLAELGGKSILFTGDARGDKIIDGVQEAGLFGGDGTLKVDLLKVPHHGSSHNVELDFFKKFVADTYVFSANGKDANPDRETLEMLRDARGKNAKYHVVLTYPVSQLDTRRKAVFDQKGIPWSAAKTSLKRFFEDAAQDGHKFTFEAGAPTTIDLGDETIDW